MTSPGVEIVLLDAKPPTLQIPYLGMSCPRFITEVIPITVNSDVQEGLKDVATQQFVSVACVHLAAWLAALQSAPGMGNRPAEWKIGFPYDEGNNPQQQYADILTFESPADIEMKHQGLKELYQVILRKTTEAPPSWAEQEAACPTFDSVFCWENEGR